MFGFIQFGNRGIVSCRNHFTLTNKTCNKSKQDEEHYELWTLQSTVAFWPYTVKLCELYTSVHVEMDDIIHNTRHEANSLLLARYQIIKRNWGKVDFSILVVQLLFLYETFFQPI